MPPNHNIISVLTESPWHTFEDVYIIETTSEVSVQLDILPLITSYGTHEGQIEYNNLYKRYLIDQFMSISSHRIICLISPLNRSYTLEFRLDGTKINGI